jgi:hypothetical protein
LGSHFHENYAECYKTKPNYEACNDAQDENGSYFCMMELILFFDVLLVYKKETRHATKNWQTAQGRGKRPRKRGEWLDFWFILSV